MLFSFLLVGLWTAQALAAPCTVFKKSAVGHAKDVPMATNVAAIPSVRVVERRGRGLYQTIQHDEVADRPKEISTLSARIPVTEAEAEAGRGIYQLIETEDVDGEGESTA